MISLPNVFDSFMKDREKVITSSYDNYEISAVTIINKQQRIILGTVSGAILIVANPAETKYTKLNGHKGQLSHISRAQEYPQEPSRL